ncbi:helix-turn-helix transcriptional regulator [Cellulomonas fimi]|uniref:Transcriptional regulator protein-like protein n=1 Tax=Cellulomonas fimi (strain ATCC 484 / DSM 20113 / JCM 1341 / CCUG 24087 / LMG 16345 / NBRC 15513 / NCIMB 8980 / NCTC 7547 / NRS-133) TaxID=590998 RepID=F4GZP1_CELFA|nr:WYL domain-containing protein [Cellulomonas fimi]AEE46085.1 transcriptional regulator protein-like protein [Cellulomonas fimi ATCC 484]NNH06936.1 WYL domain-containing protein [Cellulomonas fimi]VEH31569.1 Proteasome accessory factor C [Cellulomonas fimi]
MAERASDRLVRMLGMIAYLDRHAGVPVEEIAEQFGVSAAQVLQDIDTLWVTGTPGYFPHDLIDFDAASYEQGVVRLTESRGMTRPLRLGTREAVALLAALRALDAALRPALDEERALVLSSALAKLTAATGDAAAALDVRLGLDASPDVASALATALRTGRRLHLRYVDAADVATERDVDPLRLVTDDERSYLLAWCHLVDGERLFRVDRVLGARVLDVPVADHTVAPDAGEFQPGPEGELVTLHLRSQARWVAESTPVEEVRNLEDGSFEVDLRVVRPAWVRHLLLQVADDVLDVRPARVAAEVATAARVALEAYGPLAGED